MGQRFPFSSVFGGGGGSPSASRDANGKYSRAGLVPTTSAALYDLTAGGPAVETVTVDGTGKASFTATTVAGHTYVVDGVTRASGGTVPAGTAPPQTFSGVVANRGAIASRSTVTPAAGVLTGNQETQHTLLGDPMVLELCFDNITTDGGTGIILSGLPDKKVRAGVRIRAQAGLGFPSQIVLPAYAEDPRVATQVTRDVVIPSGQKRKLWVQMPQRPPSGLSLLVAPYVQWPTTPTRYAETDTQCAAFNELNEFGAALPDKSLSLDSTGPNPWNNVGKVTSYAPNVVRWIRGHDMTAPTIAVYGLGDSIFNAGDNDSASSTPGQGARGGMQKALLLFPSSIGGCTGLSLANVRTNPNRLAATLTMMQDEGFNILWCALNANSFPANIPVSAQLDHWGWLNTWCNSMGIKLVATTCLPRTNGSNGSQSTNAALDSGYAAATGKQPWQAVLDLNAGLQAMFPANRLVPAHAAVADPNDPTKWRTDSGFTFSGDGIHPAGPYHNSIRDVAVPILQAA